MKQLLLGVVLTLLFLLIRQKKRKQPRIWFDGVILRLEDLAIHGREMGKFHRVKMAGPSCGFLIGRLEENLNYISRVYHEVASSYDLGNQIAPAGEWLLDNYYIIEEHVKDILLTVKKGRFKDLPLLCNGSLKGAPRIYAIALEVVSHTDGGICEQALISFIEAYQEEASLTISEIWTLALMVRIALVEKIRHICVLIEESHRQWRQAEYFLEKTRVEKVKDRLLQGEILPAFTEHLLELSRGDEIGKIVREVVAEKLLTQDLTIEKLVHTEHQNKAAQTTAMANTVSSLKSTAHLDWDRLFERLSSVDKILRTDPIFIEMDSYSRNHYRRRVQALAKRQKTSETRIARLAVEKFAGGETPRQKHCGYYLFEAGKNTDLHLRSLVYIVFQIGVSVGLAILAGSLAFRRGTGWAVGFATLFILPSSEIVVGLVNRVLARLRKPAFLPKLEFRDGIPPTVATLVVVPALLPDLKRARELVTSLERHYLANPEENLYYALLGDFKDASQEETENDGEIIYAVSQGIASLNLAHGKRFFPLIRKRRYCQTQRKWLGWERKRGALVELNALLMGEKETSFIKPPPLPQVRYVLTVDADTRLPFSMVKKLVGTIAHPLNALSLEAGKPLRGYGLIQPRISTSVESVNKSFFAKVMAGPGGSDTYSNGISNTYQDWFGQGIFTGKGIYDLPAAYQLLSALPENSILSHDLLEGGILRTGLATDTELVDDFPTRFGSYFARSHRWTRGDWQLLPWLFSRVKGKDNPLSLLSRWQIADNLRRSLVPIGQVTFLAFALLVWEAPWLWLLVFVSSLVLPALFSLLDINWKGYFRNRFAGEKQPLGGPGVWLKRLSWQLVFLPYQAWLNADAILRTLCRLLSRKNLLEWMTAAEAEKAKENSYFSRFAPVLFALGAMALLVAVIRPMNLAYYLPLLLAWLYGPILAELISREGKSLAKLTAEDTALLLQLAWQTWLFYDELVDEGTSYLPPDNYQVRPARGIDNRTSPTNIGFYLLALLAARDFGFITLSSLITAVAKTLSSLERMEKWRGHFYNWYSIEELKLLRPRFISTVDSGNFACMLVVLIQGLKESLHQPLFSEATVKGLEQALGVAVPSFNGTLLDWENILAQPVGMAAEKGIELMASYREELVALLPQTEILANPPVFLAEDQRYSTLAEYAMRAKENPSLENLTLCYTMMLREIAGLLKGTESQQEEYLVLWQDDIFRVEEKAKELQNSINTLVERLSMLLERMDFSALYNAEANLFSIGYSVEDEKLSDSNYDLLASEARLTSYLAIVQHQVPPKHWLKLGRAQVRVDGGKALVSWAGTMFEYLMPTLFLKNYANTILGETIGAIISTQRRYGEKHGLPWGVSESGYYAFDYRLNYQYKAFGIPNLGLKRGLSNDFVVSPYSTLLALPFAPQEAMANIHRLIVAGMVGRYGLYEAVDYTSNRLGENEEFAIVESYFAHHQGMGLISLTNFLHSNSMVRRFYGDPRVQAGDLMLQETPSRQPVLQGQARALMREPLPRTIEREEIVRSLGLPIGSPPKCHLLSNGFYSLLLTDSGSGYSRNGHIQVSRWRGTDGLKYGTFIFIKSLNNNRVWSATLSPLDIKPDFYRVRFYRDRASYFHEMQNIDTKTEIVVATEDNAEVRRLSLTNHGTKEVSLEVTSFFELALADQGSDLAHPAFNNLFIETELVAEYNCLLAFRRSRRRDDPVRFAAHLLIVEGESIGSVQYETDRNKFIGRGRDISNPAALNQPLSNTTGQVLDPCMSLRRQIRVGAGKSAVFTFITTQGNSRGEMLKLAAKYSDSAASQRAFDMARVRSLVERRFLDIDPELLAVSQQAIGHILFLSPTRRRFQEEVAQSRTSQQSLWAQGISGDNPIVLVTIHETEGIKIVEEVILAHEYWRFKGLTVDLVILHGGEGGYYEPVGDLVREMVQLNRIGDVLDKPGGIYIRSTKKLLPGEQYLFHGVASLILSAGSFAKQLISEKREMPPSKEFTGISYDSKPVEKHDELLFNNGFGGFTLDGKEYVITLQGRMTPAPWSNILANPEFGCLITERGGGYVFAENSRENKLTPWSNDPVVDPPGEIIYLRDEEGGAVWTVTAAPILEDRPYQIRHGQGYSIFSHHSQGLRQELTVFVPLEESVKVSVLTVRNDSCAPRKLSATYFIKPVLGVSQEVTKLHISSSWQNNTLIFRNQYNSDFPGRTLWISASLPVRSFTGDELEFLGPEGGLENPSALKREKLSNTVGVALQPCGVIQVAFELEPGSTEEVVFLLGQGRTDSDVREIRLKYCEQPWDSLSRVKEFWQLKVRAIRTKTPEPSLDVLLGWALYQALVCRMWARTGFYQCGGAYGFRDQLQDAANLALTIPTLARKQILLHAEHQFREGDVQHWWHPGTNNRGVRTRFSDDLLWLPWTVADYVERTGDGSILEEKVHFLEGSPLEPGSDERYGEATTAEEIASVYEHCRRAIDRSLCFGRNGLPLMGSGDWNDGMSNVGNLGEGESVWLGWFLYDILRRFSPLCHRKGEPETASLYLVKAETLRRALEKNGWDGRWYRRAYFDDGTPLGSAENSECSIDSIPQSWAVISGGGGQDRVAEAMEEVEKHLVHEEEGIILLFAPPFATGDLNPGYIKGYVPGVRENGGQYTHAACWAIKAQALLGQGDKAMAWAQMLNPIGHTGSLMECLRYKTEPYVLAADVYFASGHKGRGGWSWYTGAAGWFYRVVTEDLLGLRRRGDVLIIDPCIPKEWREYQLEYTYGNCLYSIKVLNPLGLNTGVSKIEVDGVVCAEIPLQDTGRVSVIVLMGEE